MKYFYIILSSIIFIIFTNDVAAFHLVTNNTGYKLQEKQLSQNINFADNYITQSPGVYFNMLNSFYTGSNFSYNNDGDEKKALKRTKGIYKWTNGDVYTGEFVKDTLSGFGIMQWKTGERYEGYWEKNKRNGHGVYYYKNGNKYIGEFKNNFRNGLGTIYYQNGKEVYGVWENNNMVKILKEDKTIHLLAD